MKSILFLCESYYRLPSPNGICVQAVAETAVKEGYHVDVVTIFNSNDQSEYETVNGVTVYRVDPGFIRRELFKTNPEIYPEKNQCHNLILKLSALNGLIKAFRYPYLSRKQVVNLQMKAEELYKQNRYQHVVIVYQQIHPVLAGINLKKKYPKVDLTLYTLDAISGGWVPNILHSHKISMNSLKKWEQYFFNNVDRVFAMESHFQQYQSQEYELWREKIHYLDIPLLRLVKQAYLEKPTDGRVRFVFTGSMHKDTANPKYLLKLLPQLQDVEVDIYGSISPDIMEEMKESGLLNKQLFYKGRVGHDEILEIQRNADVLLNFGNANPNMIPCKIFEYISTGRKIISFTHSSEDSSLPYMRRYTNSLILEEDDKRLEQTVRQVIQFLSVSNVVDEELLKDRFKKNMPEYFLAMLKEEVR